MSLRQNDALKIQRKLRREQAPTSSKKPGTLKYRNPRVSLARFKVSFMGLRMSFLCCGKKTTAVSFELRRYVTFVHTLSRICDTANFDVWIIGLKMFVPVSSKLAPFVSHVFERSILMYGNDSNPLLPYVLLSFGQTMNTDPFFKFVAFVSYHHYPSLLYLPVICHGPCSHPHTYFSKMNNSSRARSPALLRRRARLPYEVYWTILV